MKNKSNQPTSHSSLISSNYANTHSSKNWVIYLAEIVQVFKAAKLRVEWETVLAAGYKFAFWEAIIDIHLVRIEMYLLELQHTHKILVNMAVTVCSVCISQRVWAVFEKTRLKSQRPHDGLILFASSIYLFKSHWFALSKCQLCFDWLSSKGKSDSRLFLPIPL